MGSINKLQKLYEEIEELKKKTDSKDSDFQAWHTAVEICLTDLFGKDSIQLREFKHRLFSPTCYFPGGPDYSHRDYLQGLETTQKEFERYLEDFKDEKGNDVNEYARSTNKVFIIHGHDETLKEKIARLLEKQGIDAIILSEKANQGRTIIEKIEAYNDVSVAIALFTNDDMGNKKSEKELNNRARQNVVFEAGYFIGLLNRENVVIVAEKGIEMPSDLGGVVYTSKDNWEIEVMRELKAAGLHIDMNKLF